MHCVINKSTLLPVIQQVLRFVSTKPQLPVLSAFYIQAVADRIVISATDLHLGMRTSLPSQIKSPGAVVVPAKMFVELIQSLQTNEIEIQVIEQTLTIKAGKANAQLQVFPEEDFPPFPEKQGDKISLPSQLILDSVDQVSFAASKDETRPILTSILFQLDKQSRIVATDGYRLAILDVNYSTDQAKRILFTARSIQEVAKAIALSNPENVEVSLSEGMKQAFFDLGDTEIVARVIDGAFPEYMKIFPKEFVIEIECDKEALEAEIKAAMIFSKQNSGIIKFQVKEQQLSISSGGNAQGSYTASIDIINKSKEERQIAFNGRYVADFLQRTSSQTILFKLNDPLKPGLFVPQDRSDFQYLVMPFRLSGE